MRTCSTDRRRWVLACLVAALAAVPYLNGLGGEFTFDDLGVIRDNPMVRSEPLANLFTESYRVYWYRPLTLLTYVVNDRCGETVVGYHVTNLILHALVTVGVLVIGGIVLRSAYASAAAAAIFAVHPIHTEAVTSIVGRAELLAAFFSVATVLAFVRALRAEKARQLAWHALGAVCFGAGLLSKESAFTTLGLLPVLHWWTIGRLDGRRAAVAMAPYVSIAAAYLAVRYLVMGALSLPTPPSALDNPLAYVPAESRIGTAVVVLWEYLSQLAFPRHLSADYSYNEIAIVRSVWDVRLVLAAAGLAAVATGIAVAARRAPQVLVATAFLVVPMALTTNILFPIGTIKAERLLYLPSVGWCLLLGWGLSLLLRPRPQAGILLVAALVSACAVRTSARNRDWQDNRALFESAVRASPRSAKAHYNLAVAYYRADRLSEANVHFRRALQIYPGYAEAAFGIGEVYARKGIDVGAVQWYERALRLDWEQAKFHLKLGLARRRTGESDAAMAAFLTGLAIDPSHRALDAHLNALLLPYGEGGARSASADEADSARSVAGPAHARANEPSIEEVATP